MSPEITCDIIEQHMHRSGCASALFVCFVCGLMHQSKAMIMSRRSVNLTSLSHPVEIFLLTVPRRCFFCGSSLLFMFRVCHDFLSVHCSLMVTCWEYANLLALLYVKFYCLFVTLQYGVLVQVWYLIVSIPDLCLLTYFNHFSWASSD